MKYFLTGISGFIGLNLARQLVTDGHTVHAIIRGPVPEEFKDNPSVSFFKADLQSVEKLKEAMEGCEAAFHLAAFARPWSKDPGDFHRINVEGAANVFEAALRCGLKKVVFTSSAATMSPSNGQAPANESTIRTIPYFNSYESTKAEAERLAQDYCKKGLPVVIVNPTRVYGPGPINASNSMTRMIDGYRKGSWRIIPGNGKNIGNYVYIDDVVYGHMLAAQKGKPGEKYILGGENLTFDELFSTLGKITGTVRRMVHLPLVVMTITSKLMVWQNSVTGIPPAITPDFVKKYMNHWSLSSDKAISELGYKVTSFESGAGMTLEWLIRNLKTN
jgi:nucleoside-diphosphate-sugar epimerase